MTFVLDLSSQYPLNWCHNLDSGIVVKEMSLGTRQD